MGSSYIQGPLTPEEEDFKKWWWETEWPRLCQESDAYFEEMFRKLDAGEPLDTLNETC